MIEQSALQAPSHRKAPDETRRKVLQAAFEEIRRKGFQAASLSKILQDTGLTKGALYHHFPNKLSLGYAVLDEVIAPELRQHWINPLEQSPPNPLKVLSLVLTQSAQDLSDEDILLGCPLNNLSQEMSPVDEGFRLRIDAIFEEWRGALAQALERAKDGNTVHINVDTVAAASFIVAALEGCVGMAKNAQRKQVLLDCGRGVLAYLDTLRYQ